MGILAADLSLYAGDYRASERTFQLLTQAAGRAGRGREKGVAVIQTYSPEHYSIRTAAAQDYEEFFRQEMAYRSLMHYPPAAHLMALYLTSEDQEELEAGAVILRRLTLEAVRRVAVPRNEGLGSAGERQRTDEGLRGEPGENGGIQVIGPADAGLTKLKDMYRKVLYLKCKSLAALLSWKENIEPELARESGLQALNIQFDMDPVNPF